MKNLKIVYMATAEIACPTLSALVAAPNLDVCAVISQPDKPQGRKRNLKPSPVKALATELEIPVRTPEKVGDNETKAWLQELGADLQIVFAYGQYIPSSITEMPRLGSINLHPSMLPAYRGAAPIQWAIADGLDTTGISVIRLAKKMDAGDIICQREVTIDRLDTSASLFDRMAIEASTIILDAIDLVAQPDFRSTPQDDSLATEARKFEKEDREINWDQPAKNVARWIHACNSWPGAHMQLADREVKLLLAEVVEVEAGNETAPGRIIRIDPDGPVIATGAGEAIRILRIQPPGKQAMDGGSFARGYLKDA